MTLLSSIIVKPISSRFAIVSAVGAVSIMMFAFSATPSHATVPGYDGRIAFHTNQEGNFEIESIGADGLNQARLTNDPAVDSNAAYSPNGSAIVFVSNRDGNNEIYIMAADGSNVTRITNNLVNDNHPTWSPDGSKIVFFSERDGNREIYLMNADGTNPIRLTNNPAADTTPQFSPDGSKITFTSTRNSNIDIYVMQSDGTNVIRLTTATGTDENPNWSPDGQRISFDSVRDGNAEIYVMNADGSNQVRLTNDPGSDLYPAFSPDGYKIAFSSNREGTFAVYLMNLDGSNQHRISPSGFDGRVAAWQPIPNKAPATENDLLTMPFNTAGTAAVLSNDTDEEALSGSNLSISVQPSHGSATVDSASGKITYTPTAGYSGFDALTYRICDSFLLDQKCATAVLGITVQAATPTLAPIPTPMPPSVSLSSIGTLKTVAGEHSYYYTGHRPTFVGTATPGATITIEIHSDPIILTTVANGAGEWIATPTQDLPNGDHTITITATKDGGSTALASYTLGINTGLAETGAPLWPWPLAALVTLISSRIFLRRRSA